MKNQLAEYKNYQNMVETFMAKHRIEELIKEFDFKHECKVYLGSGQMFNDFGRLGLEILADICESVHLDYYLPQHNTSINNKDTPTIITNRMIAEGDNEELATCQILFSHFTIPEDSGLSAECGRFGYMKEIHPDKHWCSVAIMDDIRALSIPNPRQLAEENQVIYMNSYTAGIPDYFGSTLYDCFSYMYECYQKTTC